MDLCRVKGNRENNQEANEVVKCEVEVSKQRW